MAGSGGVSLTGGPATGRPGVPNGGKGGAGRPAPPKSKPVQVKAHTRNVPAVKNTSTVTHVLPEGFKVRPRGPATNPLLNPNQTLSGKSLAAAAGALTNVQTQGPLTELGKQIAANNAHTRGTINATGGFYNQLEPFVQSGVDQQGKIAADLKSQLTGIGNDTQSQLQGIGGNAMSSLLKYAPGDNASAATSDLAAQIARQQGLAAQQAGTYRSFGANQSANYGDLGASQLGTFGLQGQEALKGIAQSGTVQNQPLMAKIAGIQASKGALTATNLGKLRQQEVSNGIARAGLGLGQAKVAATLQGQRVTAQNNAANQALKAAGIKVAAANDAASQALRGRAISVQQQNNLAGQALKAAQINEKTKNDAANQALKQAALNLRAAQGLGGGRGGSGGRGGRGGRGGGVKPLTTAQNNLMYRLLGQASQLISDGQSKKVSEHQIRAYLQDGNNPAKRAFDPVLIEAAYELKGYGRITPATARAMRAMGLRGGTYNGRPITVGGGGGFQHNAGAQSNKSAPSAGNLAAAGF